MCIQKSNKEGLRFSTKQVPHFPSDANDCFEKPYNAVGQWALIMSNNCSARSGTPGSERPSETRSKKGLEPLVYMNTPSS